MDYHHSLQVNQTQDLKLNNGWIPNQDVILYTSKNNSQYVTPATATRTEANQQKQKYQRYEPSLEGYPLSLLKNLTSPVDAMDVIFFWHIPKAAGTSTKAILTNCFHLSRAEQISLPESYEFIKHVLNVDTSTIAGISRAKDNGFAQKDILDVVVSSYLHEGSALLTETHRGRLFAMMRDPVDTAISLFFYLGNADWEGTYREEFRNMTLLEYATSDKNGLRIDNWMTRYLVRKVKGELDEHDIQLAKRYSSIQMFDCYDS